MEKHEACAAAINSSGLVLPSERSVRDAHVTGNVRQRPAVDAHRPIPMGQVAFPDALGSPFGHGHDLPPLCAGRPAGGLSNQSVNVA